MKRHELTRTDTEKLQRDPGELAETLAAENYSGYSLFGVERFDVWDEDTGKMGEVKSTATTLQNDASGRFRLWKEQHEKLLRADRDGTGRYVFVLFDVSQRPPVAKLKEKIPREIGYMIGARGGWYRSGHASEGLQYKLPWDEVF